MSTQVDFRGGEAEDVPDLSRLRSSLLSAVYDRDHRSLDGALRDLAGDARRRGIPPERLVVTLKALWDATPRPSLMGAEDWDAVYRYALDGVLALYFEEPGAP